MIFGERKESKMENEGRIEPGQYKARPFLCNLGEASTGTKYVGVAFNIDDIPGVTLWWNGYFHPATIEKTVEQLQICGWSGDNISVFDDWHQAKEEGFGSRDVSITIANELDSSGVTKPRIKWINRLGSGKSISSFNSKEMSDLSNKVKAIVAKKKATAPKAPSQPATKNSDTDPLDIF